MEHIIRSLNKAPELSEYIEDGFDTVAEEDESGEADAEAPPAGRSLPGPLRFQPRAHSRASTTDGKLLDGEDVNPEMERRFFGSPIQDRRSSQISFADVADRHLQDKTDAIADIIRNISEQCAAAVEGLHLARDADNQTDGHDSDGMEDKMGLSDGEGREHSVPASEVGEPESNDGLLRPQSGSSYPPTPDLVHRSSTSMSINSQSTTPERHSQQFVDLPTKIVEHDDEDQDQDPHGPEPDETEPNTGDGSTPTGTMGKQQPRASLFRRPAGARISALGHA